jgi:hypothetical protein
MKIGHWLWFRGMAAATGVFALAFSGCSGVPDSTTAGAKSASGPEPAPASVNALQKGMKPDEVRALLGEPRDVSQRTGSAGPEETWSYRRRLREYTNQKVTGTSEFPYVDPITGQTRMILEPIYTLYTVTEYEELTLQWRNGELVEWSGRRVEVNSFDR